MKRYDVIGGDFARFDPCGRHCDAEEAFEALRVAVEEIRMWREWFAVDGSNHPDIETVIAATDANPTLAGMMKGTNHE